MLTISQDGIIALSRGDSCTIPLFINSGSAAVPVRFQLSENPDAVVYLSIMEPNHYFEQGFIKKLYNKNNWVLNENGDLLVEFTPKDTMYVVPGKYFYEIKIDLTGQGTNINTII